MAKPFPKNSRHLRSEEPKIQLGDIPLDFGELDRRLFDGFPLDLRIQLGGRALETMGRNVNYPNEYPESINNILRDKNLTPNPLNQDIMYNQKYFNNLES